MRKVIPWRPSAGVPLSNNTLRLHSQRIDVPTYDRSTLQRGVVHIGAGNFHRAHQAVYFDDLACSGISTQWGLTGVSLRSRDVKDVLSAQDGLYTVVERPSWAESTSLTSGERRLTPVTPHCVEMPEQARSSK